MFSVSVLMYGTCNVYLPLIQKDQEVLLTWDGQIQNVCHLVNSIVDKISAQHSDWVTTANDNFIHHRCSIHTRLYSSFYCTFIIKN